MKSALIAAGAAALPVLAAAQGSPAVRVATAEAVQVGEWDRRIAQMTAQGELAVRWEREDTLLPGRTHQRLAQVHHGVPVYGGELVRQREGGRTLTVFGTWYPGIAVETRPTLTADQAVGVVERLSGRDLGPLVEPRLLVLPRDGGYRLCFVLRALTGADLVLYFIDAHTGALAHSRSDLQTQSGAVGTGTGVLGDEKKMSTQPSGASFLAEDELRPPPLRTYDMRGNLDRVIQFLNGQISLVPAVDLARDADNTWSDGAVVDAHAYAGWTYDYFFKRMNRRGLDANDGRIISLVHPVNRADIFAYDDDIIGLFYLNAAYFGSGVMVYGEGIPSNLRLTTGQYVDFWSASLDTVAHELTHGVTDFSSGLIYENESGALNEAFSDIMAAGVEFLYQPPGAGLRQADYLVGEDVVRPGGFRSMADPQAYGDPDHYSIRFTGSADNGGVHINSGIANNAFYLAVEGGVNRTSGLAVQGVGAANREQIERVFYRAFTFMLPPSADFSTARAATIQSARDLFNPGSAPERAVTQAWAAVGVQ
jgi:thermolysin